MIKLLFKVIVLIIVLELLLSVISTRKREYVAQEFPKMPVEGVIKPKTVLKAQLKHKKVVYTPPTGLALKMALIIEKETGIPNEIISKIMFAESRYDPKAKHINKNKSYDSGLMQINSQHIPLAKKMGIDIFTPEGNTQFAIYLIKKNGLRDWGYSKSTWSKI